MSEWFVFPLPNNTGVSCLVCMTKLISPKIIAVFHGLLIVSWRPISHCEYPRVPRILSGSWSHKSRPPVEEMLYSSEIVSAQSSVYSLSDRCGARWDENRRITGRYSVRQVVNNNQAQNAMRMLTIEVYTRHISIQEGVYYVKRSSWFSALLPNHERWRDIIRTSGGR